MEGDVVRTPRGWLAVVALLTACGTATASSGGPYWSRIPHQGIVFGGVENQGMESVTSGGPGLVAVGFDAAAGDWDAAVWTSPDGLNWTRVPHDELTMGGTGNQGMESVVSGGPGLVAVGLDFSGGDEDAAVWTSPDGLNWTRVPHDETIFGGPGDQEMESVTTGGPGLVAVGLDSSSGYADAAVWTSPDGLNWTRVPHDEDIFGGPGVQEMESITTGGPGLVAVGLDYAGGHAAAAAWVETIDR